MNPDLVARLQQIGARPDLEGTPYRLEEEIGRGGMGIVYRALDTRLDRRVALKVVPPGASVERIRREARVLAQLEHPGIVPVHDVGDLADGRVFYTMKLVAGLGLDDWLATGPALSERLRVFQRACEPVAFAHARGVVHRDLKPQNIMIGAFGEVLVMDWGVAKTDAEADPATIIGTSQYMSPEQARGDSAQADARSDVYSLGRMLEEMTTQPRPRPLAAMIRKATFPDRAGRYPDAAAFASDISRYLDGQPVSAFREAPWDRVMRLLRKHRALAALVTTYLLVRILLFFFPRP